MPELIVVDRTDIGLRDAFRFIRRQLLWTRLYSPRWWSVLGHAGCGAAAAFGPLSLALLFAAQGDSIMAATGVFVFIIYMAAMVLLLERIDSHIGRTCAGKWPRFSGLSPLIVLSAAPLTQVVYLAALCGAIFTSTIEWRGIRYALDGPMKIRRLGLQPRGKEQ